MANVISVGRLLLLIPLFVFLRRGREGSGDMWALVIMGAALVSDMLDGLIARRLHQESDWGRLLDPIADKVWIGCLALFLALPWREHPLPWLFLALVIARDVTIVLLGVWAYRRTGIVMASNWAGKVAMGLTALTLIAYTIYDDVPGPAWLRPETVMWLATAMIVLSASLYLIRLRALMAGAAPRPAQAESSTPQP